MSMKQLTGLVLSILFLAGCKTSKPTSSADTVTITPSVFLDSITIVRYKDDLYQASLTKAIDMVHTHLKVDFDWTTQRMNGAAELTLKPHFYTASSVVLDAKNMDIKRVALLENGLQNLTYTYDSLQLNIALGKEIPGGQSFKLYIEYTAKPNEKKIGGSAAIQEDKGLYFINPLGKEQNKPQQIWTQGETESNSNWFPCIDKPNQKMTQEIEIKVASNFKTLSNGLLTRSIQNADGTRSDVWTMNQPHAPYLAMMTIGNFEVVRDYWNGKEVSYYVEPEFKQYARAIFGKTPAMLEFFSNRLGVSYPWPKYAQIVARDYVSGAMENTSATLHGEFLQKTSRQLLDENNEDIISHELFHQWFGDLVTCESWSNIPLNESFATYGEYLWNEFDHGKQFADWRQHRSVQGYFSEAKNKKTADLIRFYYDDREDMFDAHSYNKGGAILHMLRKEVGDEAFFKSIELYLKANQFKSVEIHNLRLAFEEVTGRDMNRFFNQWMLNSGHPVLKINYTHDADSVYVDITQKQSNDKGLTYQLPLKVNVHYGGIVMTYPILLKNKKQHFAFKLLGTPDLIDVDPERIVLCEKKENKTVDEYVYQYQHNHHYNAKREAIEALKDSIRVSDKATALYHQALQDPFFGLRKDALNNIGHDSISKSLFLNAIERMANSDSSNRVKQDALSYLSKLKDEKYLPMFTRMLSDSSYKCVSTALTAINKLDTTLSQNSAIVLLKEPDNELKGVCYTVLSERYDSSLNHLFQSKLNEEAGYTKTNLFYHYANYLTHGDSALVAQGLQYLYARGAEDVSKKYNSAAKKSIERVRDYIKKRSDAPFYEAIKTLADDLIDKLKKLE
jgi:aminopeptidase N